jgi:hypothetical protein
MLARTTIVGGTAAVGLSRWVPHLSAEGRPRTRPEYFMRLPAGLEATGAMVSLDELLDY